MAFNNGTRNNNRNFNNNRANNRNNGYKNNYNSDRPSKPRKEVFVFPLVSTFTTNTREGAVEVDKNIVMEKLGFLEENDIFRMLTQNVTISNAVFHSDETRKGSSTIGFIDNIDANGSVAVVVFGTAVETMKNLTSYYNMAVQPRILINNQTGEFRCFNGFQLVTVE